VGLKEDYLTISEAAEQIGVTRQTISRWLKGGELKSESLGRIRLVSKKDLLSFQKDKRMTEIVDKKIVGGAREIIRSKLGYSKDDEIEMVSVLNTTTSFSGYFVFVVSRKDDTLDKIKFYPHFKRLDDGVLFWASKIEREQYTKTGTDTFNPLKDLEEYLSKKKANKNRGGKTK